METLKIPKLEKETDEANWLYENREGLAAASLQAAQAGRVRQETLKRRAYVESMYIDAIQTKEIVVTPEELNGRCLASVLGEKFRNPS